MLPATKLKMKRPSLSKLEDATGIKVITLQKLVSVLGGDVEIVCKFPKAIFDSCSLIEC